MSLVGVHPGEFRSRERNFSGCSLGRKSERSCSEESLQMAREMSFEELNNYFNQQQDAVLTIEELRCHLNSCFTCGVSWNEDHVSLDCRECGGYSLERPCPECDGKCSSKWKRDLSTSHSLRKAQWEGQCTLAPASPSSASPSPPSSPTSSPPSLSSSSASSSSPDAKLQLLHAIVETSEDSLCKKAKNLSVS